MEPPVESAPAFYKYSQLPYELRLLIIEQFLLDHRLEFYSTLPRSVAEYATVSKQWKSVVEKITFRCLRLRVANADNRDYLDDTNDLDAFEKICIGDRIEFVSRIRLVILLKVLRCPKIAPETRARGRRRAHDSAECHGTMHPFSLQIGRGATGVFCRLFRTLQNWSREGQPLGLTYKIHWRYPLGWDGHNWKPRMCATYLSIDSSSFPEVPCIGSLRAVRDWGTTDYGSTMHPASVYDLLKKLPNVTHTDLDVHEHLDLPQMVEILKGELPRAMKTRFVTLTHLCRRTVGLQHPGAQTEAPIDQLWQG